MQNLQEYYFLSIENNIISKGEKSPESEDQKFGGWSRQCQAIEKKKKVKKWQIGID